MKSVDKPCLLMNIIVAACENKGIGRNGDLPWKLKKEMAHFKAMTTSTKDESKRNAVVMGRKTWESVPPKFRPLPQRTNVVLSNTVSNLGEGVLVCRSLDEALTELSKPPYSETIETVWVVGGSKVYEGAMKHKACKRIYLTEVMKTFECDTFLPEIPEEFKLAKDERVPEEIQEENGIQYVYKVYEKE